MGRLRALYFLLASLSLAAFNLNCGSSASPTTIEDPKNPGAVILKGDQSSLSIPSGIFPKPMNATLTEVDSTLNHPALNVLSKQIELEFSEIQMSQNEAGMRLEVYFNPDSDPSVASLLAESKTLYFMVKAEGGLSFDEVLPDHDWSAIVGTFDTTTSTIALQLFSTAKKYSIVAVAGPQIPIVISDLGPKLIASDKHSKNQIPSESAGFDISQFPCAVACNPAAFPNGEAACNSEVLGRLAEECRLAIQGLAKEDLKYAYWQRFTVGELRAAGYSLITSNSASDSTEVNTVYISPPLSNPNPGPCGSSAGSAVAFYSSENRVIQFYTTDTTNSPLIFPHEICHGIQLFYNSDTDAYRAIPKWMKEGTAAFCETYSLAPMDRIKRRRGTARNFAFPLNGLGISAQDGVSEGISSQDFSCKMANLPYQTSEFWAYACQGELSCLKDVFSGMKANSENSLQKADQIFAQRGTSLETIYTNLIHSRDLDPQYSYCHDIDIVPNEVVSFSAKPFSALCRDIHVLGAQNGCFRLQSSLAEEANVLLIQNGNFVQPGSNYNFQGTSVRLWVLNREFSRNEELSLQIKQFPCGCGDGLPANGEECDDGNNSDGDGCSSDCQAEANCPSCACDTQYTDSCFMIEEQTQDYPLFCCGSYEQIVYTTDCLPPCTIDNVTATYCGSNPVGCEPY